MNQTLPIDVIPNTQPPRFRWFQSVHTMTGKSKIACEGALPAGVENAVLDLINLAKRQSEEIKKLERRIADVKAKTAT